MSVRLKVAKTKFKGYAVKGATLPELWTSIMKKCKRDPNDNKKVPFLTTTTLSFDPDGGQYEGVGEFRIERRTGWYEADAKIKSIELTLTSQILGPKRDGGKGLSLKATVEWYRYYACAMLHEMEHVMKAKKESEIIVRELDRLRGSGLGETKTDAANAAIDDLKTKMYDNYIRGMEKRLNKIHAAYDRTSKHGAKHGAELDRDVT